MKKKTIILSVVALLLVAGGVVGWLAWNSYKKKKEEKEQFVYCVEQVKKYSYLYCELEKIIYADLLSSIDFYNKQGVTFISVYPSNIKYRLLIDGDFKEKDVYYKPKDLLKALKDRHSYYDKARFEYYDQLEYYISKMKKNEGLSEYAEYFQEFDSLWLDFKWFGKNYYVDSLLSQKNCCSMVEDKLRACERHINTFNPSIAIDYDYLNNALKNDICKPWHVSEIDRLASQFNPQVLALHAIMLYGHGIGTIFEK